jgi:hypothetical protein
VRCKTKWNPEHDGKKMHSLLARRLLPAVVIVHETQFNVSGGYKTNRVRAGKPGGHQNGNPPSLLSGLSGLQ